MGDTYSKIIITKVSAFAAPAMAERIIHFLIRKQIIADQLTDAVLGQHQGYPPGPHYHEALQEPGDDILNFSVNGVELHVGRQVFYQPGLEAIHCPHCGENIIDTEWGQALEEWIQETGKELIICPGCQQEQSITGYLFEPLWAFGNLGLSFWNWGSAFKEGFIRDLEKLTGYPIIVQYGKL